MEISVSKEIIPIGSSKGFYLTKEQLDILGAKEGDYIVINRSSVKKRKKR